MAKEANYGGTEVPSAGGNAVPGQHGYGVSPRINKVQQQQYTAPSSGAAAANANDGTSAPTFSGEVITKIVNV
jgi:hypothetical protein